MNHDPLSVETSSCSDATKLDKTCNVAKAMYSVACLEWKYWDEWSDFLWAATHWKNCILKLFLQKRTNNKELERKSPRVHISVGLQWALSGNQVVCYGNVILNLLKGNRNIGNEIVRIREIQLDLRPKVNYVVSQTISRIIKVGIYFFYFALFDRIKLVKGRDLWKTKKKVN